VDPERDRRLSAAPLRAYALTIALLVATVPLAGAGVGPLGLPLWALGSLLVTVVYAVTVAIALGRHFGDAGEPAPGDETDDHTDDHAVGPPS